MNNFWETVLSVLNTVWPILIAVVFFGIVVFVHEMGHFVSAKLSGVKVNEFSIGMGPALLKFGKGETRYCLRLFPIGGYVSMEGEDEASDDARSFGKAKIWKRMIIVAAGAVMNLILGLVLISIYFGVSGDLSEPVIAKFTENSVSERSGLMVNDRITDINGMRIYSTMDYIFAMSTDEDGIVDITVERNGESVKFTDLHFEMEETEDGQMIVIDFYITALESNFGTVISQGFKTTVSMTRIVWITLANLVSGHFTLGDLQGPIGIVSTVAESAKTMWQDVGPILYLTAFITVNVGTMNLLPFPALDGARLLILIIEAIRRKPIKPKYEAVIHGVGLVILLLFMLVVSVSDVSKFFGG